jgi:uncharacterized protein YjbI with pentapeptide repeats
MGARFRSMLVVAIILIIAVALIITVARFYGSGFNGYNQVTIAHTISGPSTGTIVRTEVYQPGKTLWDWLQLLIIPAVLAIGGFLLNQIQKDRDQKAEEAQKQREEVAAKERERLERESREDNQRETAVQEYIDKMSELLLKEHLHGQQPNYEARKIARIRTLTVLHRLDGKRKRIVLQFLHESGLIDKNNRIVELHGADFRQAVLNWLHLENAHLGGSFCWEVDFSDAFLHGAYLEGVEFKEDKWNRADLSVASLYAATFLDADGNKYTTDITIEEQLKQAKSLQGATMPDGKMYRNSSGADLRNADLSERDLSGVDLTGANLTGANLENAILGGIIGITSEELEKQAKSLKGATMPDGSKHP